MDKLLKPARIIFSLGMLALGVICFISKDFIVGRPPAWRVGLEINPALAYVSGALIILAALAIILNKKAGSSAMLIVLFIFFLSVLRHLFNFSDWLNAYKAMALFGGSLIVACSFLKDDPKLTQSLSVSDSSRKNMVMIGGLFLAIFFVASGYAHFKFADFVVNFIPDYIPFRTFWAYLSGICLIAGGVGVLIMQTRKWAALLSGIMVMGWFLLLHIPRFIANANDVGDRLGLCESFTFAGIFFVLAAMSSDKE